MTTSILRRFPRLRAPSPGPPVLPPGARGAYPALAADLDVLECVVTPAFREHDAAALTEQNRYRRQQVMLLVGSAAASGLAGLQVVLPERRWPGLLLAVLGAVLASSTVWAREGGSRVGYQHHRVKAERLRGLYFEYLGRLPGLDGGDRELALREAVVRIVDGREPG